MASFAPAILEHYSLSDPFPTEWPSEKDASDASEDEAPPARPQPKNIADIKLERRKSKYSALERSKSQRRSYVPKQEREAEASGKAAPKDESDPLGSSDSVMRSLRRRGPLPQTAELRMPNQRRTNSAIANQRTGNQFLPSSPSFQPTLFLTQAHSGESNQQLLQGLDFLSRSIDQKSAALKELVESNFERFVRAKATIDGVYTEMKNQQQDVNRSGSNSRHASRTSNSFRFSQDGPLSPGGRNRRTFPDPEKKKNSLTPDAEYGVRGIKLPLIQLSAKVDEVYGAAIGGGERERSLRATLTSLEKHHDMFLLGNRIAESIKRKDYEALSENYTAAKRYIDEAKTMSNSTLQGRTTLSEAQICQIVVTARMWADVNEQLENFKKETWRRLVTVQNKAHETEGPETQPEEYIELIGILLELGVKDNPIWIWLLSRFDHLKKKITAAFDRSRAEIELARRRLANAGKPSVYVTAGHLKDSAQQSLDNRQTPLDTSEVIEMWEAIHASLNMFLSTRGGLLGEVADYLDTAQAFIDGRPQRTLPIGPEGESRRHHRLSDDEVQTLQNGAIELTQIVRDNVFSLFSDPPPKDISTLLNSNPGTPISPVPSAFPRFSSDSHNIPSFPSQTGDKLDNFAFWPPFANSLSGVHYLSRLLVLVGSAASEMAAMRPIGQTNGMLEKLRSFVGVVRERCVQAACIAWSKDAENCKLMEDWTRNKDKRDVTNMPKNFLALESSVLSGMQKLMYMSEAMIKSESADVVLPPPTKLLQQVRSNFVGSLYKAFSGMVENAEQAHQTDVWGNESDDLALEASSENITESMDLTNRNVRVLLTLSNLQYLRADIVPQLITLFETNFSVKLTDETKTINNVLGQIDSRLFQSYTQPTVQKITKITRANISSPAWNPTTTNPQEVRPYVYEILLILVFVHTEVSTTSAWLTPQILSYMLEQTSFALLDAFKSRNRYSLPALIQATLDVEFVAQTLSQYTTDGASETQAKIYLELDKGTDNDARNRLQDELPEMRKILKKLREATRGEFACFKKQRPQRPERQET